MPNFDGGHYFLTALIPIKTGLVELDGMRSSPVHLVREALAVLPTAQQTEATEKIGLNSPFAKNIRTHFTRFAVIDDVSYVGRVPINPLIITIKGLNPTLGEDCDELNCPYLLWAIDFDARSGDPAELESYLAELWTTAADDLHWIFAHCTGFDQVKDPRSFSDWIRKCQVETTMPFNDYWIEPPPFPSMSKVKLALPLLVSAAVTIVGLSGLIGSLLLPGLGWLWGLLALALLATVVRVLYSNRASLQRREFPIPMVASLALPGLALLGLLASLLPRISPTAWLVITVVGLVALAGSIFYIYRQVMRGGMLPFPAAPNSDLRSVLKALYLQQKFARFAIDTQGADNPTLHAAFGRFLQQHKPLDIAVPTQAAGVIRS